MPNGRDVIDAIVGDQNLGAVNNCPGVPAQIGRAMYGGYQDDENEVQITANTTDGALNMLFWVAGHENVAAWHFSTAPTVHHFVVVPWYNHVGSPGLRYAVFMAYEGQYTLNQYIQNAQGNMGGQLARGFHDDWSLGDLKGMIQDLLVRQGAWADYFLYGQNRPTNVISCYKYPAISADTAHQNILNYHP